uniref:CIA6 n=1 Tax=Chlamydomonas reinhardtii TaxID=3055 RepID=F6LJD1_CHLRE|nr:CIA6 [Chlamydomonas reinhardtii]
MADPELLAWCRKHGVEFGGIQAAYVDEGWRGVVATRDLAPGDTVLRVPGRLLMTTRSARADPALAAALSRLAASPDPDDVAAAAALTPHQLLATHLLHEVSKGPESFWHPYLQQLPRSYTSLAHFSADDAAALQLQLAQDVAAAAAERAREEWQGALPLLRALGLPKRFALLRSWLWAASTLHSRTMFLPWCPAGALTPFGDLHNYAPPPPPYVPQLGVAEDRTAAESAAAADEVAAAGSVAAASASGSVYGAEGATGATCAKDASTGAPGVGGACCDNRGSIGAAAKVQEGGSVGMQDGPDQGCCMALELLQLGADDPGKSRCHGANGVLGRAVEPRAAVASPAEASAQSNAPGPAELRPPGMLADVSAGAEGAEPAAAHEAEDADAIAGDGSWDEARQQYVIVVRRRVAAGQQVLLCYGRHTNLELLEHYGFVMQDNPHDTAPLDAALLPVPDSARYSAGAPPLPPDECFVHGGSPQAPCNTDNTGDGSSGCGAPSWSLLHFLRYCAATPAERRTQGHRLAAGESISEQGDRIALGWLRAACMRQLEDLPTSLAQDLEELQRNSQSDSNSNIQSRSHSQSQEEGPAQRSASQLGAGDRAAVPAPQAHDRQGAAGTTEAAQCEGTQQAAAAPAAAVAVALSDGFTCAGLALQWRVTYKRALHAAISRVDALLGAPTAEGAVAGHSLEALLQMQRQGRK